MKMSREPHRGERFAVFHINHGFVVRLQLEAEEVSENLIREELGKMDNISSSCPKKPAGPTSAILKPMWDRKGRRGFFLGEVCS